MIKKLFKSKIFLCILTALITGTVSVYAITYFPSNQVTYDNKTSGLKSSDVQGAIDELYNTCSSAVSSGDYIYYAVNNYVRLDSSDGIDGHTSTVLYRANLDGTNSTVIYSKNSDNSFNQIRSSSIDAVYYNENYLYYAVNNYVRPDSSDGIDGHTSTVLYRANLDGTNANAIYSKSYDDSFNRISSSAIGG